MRPLLFPGTSHRLIKPARQLRGLSLRQLAERTGLSFPYISQLERGKRPLTPEAAERLTKALELDR